MKNSFCAGAGHYNLARVGELMAAVCLVAALAACGGGGSDAAPAPTPTPAPAPAPTPNSGDLSTTIQPTTYTAGSREATAYSALNAARLAGGFGTVAQNVALDEEATDQAAYVATNYTMANEFGGLDWNSLAIEALQPDGNETGHIQLSTLPGYIGYSSTDRAVHFGYPSTGLVQESAAFFTIFSSPVDYGAACVTYLLGSPGHRQSILDPRFRDVGFGFSTLSQPYDITNPSVFSQSCYIATAAQSSAYSSTGEATTPAGWVGVYPPNGSTVSALDDSHGHGYAPSVTVDSSLVLTTSSFTITDSNGNVVPTTLNLDGGNGYTNWAFATPNATLSPSTTYTVSFQGSAGGAVINQTWTFTTPAQ